VDGGVLRLGVTGHRALADVDAATQAVDAALDRIERGVEVLEVLEVRSLLAEGADRIVTEQAMRRRTRCRFVAVLPLAPDDYVSDFDDPASAAAFRRLLTEAAHVEVAPTPAGQADDPSREAAYERAGRVVIDTSDVLLALWDGGASRGRGGTAEMVAYARSRGVAVEVVPVQRAVPPT
jgi:hypothetical protein